MNASWLDPDGNMFLDSDERLMAPGSRRLLPWPMLRREAAELVARHDEAYDQRRLRDERLERNREVVAWTQMRRAYARRGPEDGGAA